MSQPPIEEEPAIVYGWADAPIAGDRVDVHLGPLVAGDPLGARVEVTATGLHAYDATGAETATIQGGEGVFVGGEFRTSDTLPGQVTLSDDAYVSSFDGIARPGISIEPENSEGYASPPGIGPDNIGVSIDGGKLTTGESSQVRLVPDRVIMSTRQASGAYGGVVQADAGFAQMRTDGAEGEYGVAQVTASAVSMRAYTAGGALGGESLVNASSARLRKLSGNGLEQGWVQANPTDAELAAVSSDYTYISRIRATPTMTEMSAPGARIHADVTETYLQTSAGGHERYLAVDADGVWVKTNKSGSWKHYNLEETAQDSGWQGITLAAGLAGGWSPAWRNKGGVIYMRGRVTKTGDWATGWNVLATDVGADARPASHIQRAGATRGAGATFLEVTTAGVLQVWFDSAQPGSTTVELSPMFYPLG